MHEKSVRLVAEKVRKLVNNELWGFLLNFRKFW